jgi:adenylate kinase
VPKQVRLVLLGPPGAGKGTQARALATLWGIPQVSSGDLLRTVVREDSELGREAASYMDRGQLVPDDLVLKLIDERLRKKDARKGFILDGFPRNVMQAEALAKGLDKAGLTLDKAVAVIVPDEEIVKRISGRRTCARMTPRRPCANASRFLPKRRDRCSTTTDISACSSKSTAWAAPTK